MTDVAQNNAGENDSLLKDIDPCSFLDVLGNLAQILVRGSGVDKRTSCGASARGIADRAQQAKSGLEGSQGAGAARFYSNWPVCNFPTRPSRFKISRSPTRG
jgi:hypothetical protein